MTIEIRLDTLEDPRVRAFLEEHLADMRRVSPPESVHALDLDALRQPGIQFWTAWTTGSSSPKNVTLVGTIALKHLDAQHGELKSMRTARLFRGQGIASRLLQHALTHAETRGFRRLSLETGSQPFFEPAWALYVRHGFEDCPPFGDYRASANSRFMTRVL